MGARRQRRVGSVHFHNTRNIWSLLIGRSAVALLPRGRPSGGVHLSACPFPPDARSAHYRQHLARTGADISAVHSCSEPGPERIDGRRWRVTTIEEAMTSAGGGSVIWRLAQETIGDDRNVGDSLPIRDTCCTESPTSGARVLPPPRNDRRSDTSTSEPEVVTGPAAVGQLEDSPTRRRNKRKMTEPRRRATDFSIRSICSSSNSDVERDDDDADDRSTADSSDAKIWKPGNVFDASPTTNAFSFYPLNIPLIHAFRHGIGGVGARYAATTTPTPVRPASSESSLGSSGDHDRSVQADDTSSSGGRPPSAGTRPTAADPSRQLLSQSPASTARADGEPRYGGRAVSPRKNYKNMTKQRRIEANARERTRVHTISAAFESLRRAVPSYSYNQRLSKLAILRIACSYILALARLADLDYNATSAGDSSDKQLSFAECVDLCTQTIQSEGRAKRRH